MLRVAALTACVLGTACRPAPPARPALTTTAEATGFVHTGRYEEVVRLCHDLATTHPGVAHCDELGRTGQDRPLVAVRLERRRGAPTVLIQAGIHAGEIEGKDAGLALLREILAGRELPGILDHVSIVLVPVLNPDGHERFAPNHRPNQRGPAAMGERTNGARLNLNRDYLKADSPEIRALLSVITRRDPVLLVDLHTTDGAKFEHDVAVMVNAVAPRPDGLDEAAAALSTSVIAALTARGHLPLDFYPSFLDEEVPGSGFERGEAPPRFTHAYAAARGRLAALVETHSWRTYAERARSTTNAVRALLAFAATHADAWQALARDVDRADAALGGTSVPLAWKPTAVARDLAFRGYAYEIRTSELTGSRWIIYDETRPETWTVPLYAELEPALVVTAPTGGYVIDGGFAAAVAAVLDHHGLVYAPLAAGGRLDLEVFRASGVTFAPPYEGRTRASFTGAWSPETRALDRGAIFVPIAQPHARLLLHLLEPTAEDALARWGVFNTVFEAKEYIEPYVAEQAARELFARDPARRAAFDAVVRAHPDLSPAARLDWIARQLPSWDERQDLLPVYRSAHDLRGPGTRAR